MTALIYNTSWSLFRLYGSTNMGIFWKSFINGILVLKIELPIGADKFSNVSCNLAAHVVVRPIISCSFIIAKSSLPFNFSNSKFKIRCLDSKDTSSLTAFSWLRFTQVQYFLHCWCIIGTFESLIIGFLSNWLWKNIVY